MAESQGEGAYQGGLTFAPPVDPSSFQLPSGDLLPDGTDLNKLADAVAVAETSGCTDGTAIKRKNCFGIMRFWLVNGVRHREPKYYASHAESYADFKRIWRKSYGRFPDRALAVKWTGNDNADTWLANVQRTYNR